MTAEQFVAGLDAEVRLALARIGEASAAGEAPRQSIAQLLVVALKNELEATEEAALWLVEEPDVEVKLSLARQCGDEAKHYRLIEGRLRELGVEPPAELASGPRSPMFELLRSLRSTAERVAAGPFAREALAQVRNQVFIQHCEAAGDAATATLYREIIQPDESHHHALGRKLLLRFATDDATQALARAAAQKTLALAEELQALARLQQGACRLPGC